MVGDCGRAQQPPPHSAVVPDGNTLADQDLSVRRKVRGTAGQSRDGRQEPERWRVSWLGHTQPNYQRRRIRAGNRTSGASTLPPISQNSRPGRPSKVRQPSIVVNPTSLFSDIMAQHKFSDAGQTSAGSVTLSVASKGSFGIDASARQPTWRTLQGCFHDDAGTQRGKNGTGKPHPVVTPAFAHTGGGSSTYDDKVCPRGSAISSRQA